MMAEIVYILSALTCLSCAMLLFRAYAASKLRMLMWSACCFAGLTINNILLIVDLLVIPQTDLATLRLVVADVSLAVLALGLVWESR
mgnify:CR=1 FL=1